MEPVNSVRIPLALPNLKSTLQNNQGESQYSNIDNTSVATQPWHANLLAMSFSHTLLIHMSQGILMNTKWDDHSMVIDKSLAVMSWKVTGKPWSGWAFQNELCIL